MNSAPPSSHWLDVLRDTEKAFDVLPLDQSYSLYTLLTDCFRRIAPVDSFYVCLYAPQEAKPLWFVYNVDTDGHWEEPERHPLRRVGEGPTSTVIHTRRSFVLDEGNTLIHNGALNFGKSDQVSRSAIHVPVLINAGTSREEILGVISAQCYLPGVYSADRVRALEWLADRAGCWLDRSRKAGMSGLPVAGVLSTSLPQTLSTIELADAVVQMLNQLRHRAEHLLLELPQGSSLYELAVVLNDECRRVQAEAMQLPWRLAALTGTPFFSLTKETGADSCLLLLTPQERNVLEHLDQWGETDAVLARRLGIQVSTLKFHLRNLYAKLNVENRTQAVQKYSTLFVAPSL